jgi:hypothetical protein
MERTPRGEGAECKDPEAGVCLVCLRNSEELVWPVNRVSKAEIVGDEAGSTVPDVGQSEDQDLYPGMMMGPLQRAWGILGHLSLSLYSFFF